MSVIVSNKVVLNSKEARKETLDGREHRVVPIVLMRDGVHTANAGSLYYGPKVNGHRPDRWNYMPLVVYHPEVNGQLVSARSPNILDKRQVGYVFNANYNEPSLGGEAWFDVEKTNRVDTTIIERIDKGDTLEVSAGYVLDYEETSGEAAGEKYTGVVVNTNPDHVAVLPDRKGACDTKKGCGCGVNVANESQVLDAIKTIRADVDLLLTGTKKEPTVADKNNLIKEILAYNAGYEESELKPMDEAALTSTRDTLARVKKNQTTNNSQKTETPPVTPPTPPATRNSDEDFKSFLVANGIQPNEIQDLVLGARDLKTGLIANILKAPTNQFGEEWLKAQPIKALQAIDSMLNPPQTQQVVANQQASTPWWGGSNVDTARVGNNSGPTPLNPPNVFGGQVASK
jgi:hypothetical protein